MITHGSSCELLKKLNVLAELSMNLSRDDQLVLYRKNISDNIKKTFERNSEQYNLRSRIVKYEVGQEVMRRNFAQSNQQKNFNAKLAPVFDKAKVSEKSGKNHCVLEDLDGKLIVTYCAVDII